MGRRDVLLNWRMVQLCAWLACCLLWTVNCPGLVLIAQEKNNWEVARVYVEDRDVGALVPQDYSLVELGVLAEQLKQELARRKKLLLDKPYIEEAIYVARLQNGTLISDASRWLMRSTNVDTSVAIDECTVALKSAAAIPAGYQSLIPSLRYSTDGRAMVVGIKADTQFWFAFTAASVKPATGLQAFSVGLPRATIGKMFLQIPDGIKVSSADVPFEKISDLQAALPKDWPVSVNASGGSWYAFNLSGSGLFHLAIESVEKRDSLALRHFVKRTQLNYSADAGHLKVVADFVLGQPWAGASLTLKVDKSLRLRAAFVNDTAKEWRALSERGADPTTALDHGDTHMVEIEADNWNAGDTLRIEGISELHPGVVAELPKMTLDRSFCWEGRTLLSGSPDIEVADLRALNSENTRPLAYAVGANVGWTCDWMGQPPTMSATLKELNPAWSASTFTRLLVQPESIAATTNARLVCSKLNSNEIRLAVGSGWYVDDITITQSDIPVRLRLPDEKDDAIVLTWEVASDSLRIDLQVSAHRPRDGEASQYTLSAVRVISAEGAEQKDVYGVEQTSGFQLQPDAGLQQLKLDGSELPTWQASLLVRLSDAVVYRGAGRMAPPLRFERADGTYSSKIKIIARPETKSTSSPQTASETAVAAGKLRVTYLMEITPGTGSIDHIEFALGAAFDSTNPKVSSAPAPKAPSSTDGANSGGGQSPNGDNPGSQWWLFQDGASTPQLLEQPRSNGLDVVGDIANRIVLPEPMATKFTLQTEQIVDVKDGRASIPLLNSPTAVVMDTMLMIPRQYSTMPDAMGLEVLPSEACCISMDVVEELGIQPLAMATYRYDPNVISDLEVRTDAIDGLSKSWIWSSHTDHWLHSGKVLEHRITWNIYVPKDEAFEVILPTEWVARRCLVNDQFMEVQPTGGSARLAVNLPKGNHVKVVLECISRVAGGNWMTEVILASPKTASPVLDKTEAFWLPPNRESLEHFFMDRKLSVSQRLLPSQWWSWLGPEIGEEVKATSFSIVRGSDDAVVTMRVFDRALIHGGSIVAFLVISGLAVWILGNRFRLWSGTILVCLLLTLFIDAAWVLLPQLCMLALISGAMFKLVGLATWNQGRGGAGVFQRGSTVLKAELVKVVWFVAIVSAGASMAIGQPSTGDSNNSTPQIFGVIIPVNEEGQVASTHVYAPNRLMKLLERAGISATESLEPQILNARYLLRLRGGTGLTDSYVQEFSVEFDLLFPERSSAIRLPFRASQVQLLRGLDSGQEVFIGSQLTKTNDAIIFRPAENTGSTSLRLQLIPTVVPQGDRSWIDIAIPKIATSTMSVISDEPLDIQVAGMGESKRVAVNNWQTDLGPVDQLKVSWQTRANRNAIGNLSQVQSETWLHLRDQLMAECQLRMVGANSLPKQFRVVVDAGWEPIGEVWNDCRLIASEMAPTGNRRIYTLNRPEGKDNLLIRAAMIPKNASNIATAGIPFMSLQEGGFSNRTLLSTVDRKPGWKLVGTDQWAVVKTPLVEFQWDSPLATSGPPVVLKVPSGPINATIQKASASSAVSMVREDCVLDLFKSEAQMNYRVEWPQGGFDASVVRVEVPAGLIPQSVVVDGEPARYLINRRSENQSQMLISHGSASNGPRRMDIRFSMASTMEGVASLPRPIILDCQVSTCHYRVNCRADLDCRLIAQPETNVQFLANSNDPSEILRNYSYCVGQLELGGDFRDATLLPVQYELSQRDAIEPMSNVMVLSRTEQGWRARVELVFQNGSAPTPFALFDVPANLRELIESGDMPHSISAESAGRATLCVAPSTAGSSSRIAFSFRLPLLGSSQSISIPDVLWLGSAVQRPVLALPTRIDRQSVRWTRAGRKLNDNWPQERNLGLAADDYQFFELDGQQQQTTWSPVQIENKPSEVLLAVVSVTERDQGACGLLDYWVEPNGRLEILGRTPPNCEIVGIRTGNASAVWHQGKDGQFRVLTQPSYLPVRLRMYVKWDTDAPGNMNTSTDGRFALPSLEATMPEQMQVAILSTREFRDVELRFSDGKDNLEKTISIGSSTAFAGVSEAIVLSWKSLLLRALPIASDLNTDELTSWIRDWNFANLGLSSLQSMNSMPNDPEDWEDRTVGGFWRWYISQLDSGVAQIVDSSALNENTGEEVEQLLHIASVSAAGMPSVRWFLHSLPDDPGKCEVVLTRPLVATGQDQQLLAGVGVLAGFTVLGLLIRRYRKWGEEIVIAQPWLYWAFMAVLTWLVLPINWPSVVILGCCIGLLIAQIMSGRKRMLAYRR